jgi:DUF2934 family protein
MATKRSTSQAGVSGAATARAKSPVTRKHKNSAAIERPESAKAAPSSLAESPRTAPSCDAIAQLAYSYWEARGYQGGSPEEDWLRAEQELVYTPTTLVTH